MFFLNLKQIFTEGEGDGIESGLSSYIFFTLIKSDAKKKQRN